MRLIVVQDQVLLANAACAFNGHQAFFQIQLVGHAAVESGLRYEADRGGMTRTTECAEHVSKVNWLRRRNGGIGITHRRRDNHAALDDHGCFGAEESRTPQHDVGQLADFYRAHFMGDAMRERGIDAVLGEVTTHAIVVIATAVLRQCAALHFHLVGSLPAARNHFTDTAHGLRIRRYHRERAEIMQDVFRGNRLATNA